MARLKKLYSGILNSGSLRIPIIYVVISLAWIFFSDRILFLFKGQFSEQAFEGINSAKGYFFVISTGGSLFWLIQRHIKHIVWTQNQYRELYEANPSPMWIYDPQTLKFISVNQTAISVYGYSKEEFLSMTILDIRPAEDRDIIVKHVNAIGQFKRAGVWRHIKKDGSILYADISSNVIDFMGQKAIMILSRDYTMVKEHEEMLDQANVALTDEKKRLTDIQVLSKIAGWDYYTDTRGLILSDEIYKIFNIDKANVKVNYQYFLKALHRDDVTAFTKAAKQTITENVDLDIVHRLYFGPNNIRYVRELGKPEFVNGQLYKVRGTMQDITEWKQMEVENYLINNENKKLDSIITRVNNMVVIMDANSHITWVNKAYENFTGYKLEEAVGRKPSQFMVKPDSAEQVEIINKAQERLDAFSIDIINYTKQNMPYWVNIEFTPMYDNDRFAGYITVHNNITTRKEKEEEVKKQNIILRDVAWLSSHEIRRSVASILGLLNLINLSDDEAEKEQCLKLLNDCALEMDQFIHKINDTIYKDLPNFE